MCPRRLLCKVEHVDDLVVCVRRRNFLKRDFL